MLRIQAHKYKKDRTAKKGNIDHEQICEEILEKCRQRDKGL